MLDQGMYPVRQTVWVAAKCVWVVDLHLISDFDHTFVEYTFEDNTKMYSQGRHLREAVGPMFRNLFMARRVLVMWREQYGHSRVTQFASGVPRRSLPRAKGSHRNFAQGRILQRSRIWSDEHFHRDLRKGSLLLRQRNQCGRINEKGQRLCPGIDDYTFSSTPPVVPGENGEYPVQQGVYRPFWAVFKTSRACESGRFFYVQVFCKWDDCLQWGCSCESSQLPLTDFHFIFRLNF